MEACSPDCRSNVENAARRRLVTGKPATPTSHTQHAILRTPPSLASQRLAARVDPAQPAVHTMSSYCGMDASLQLGFTLCCHSNATRAPIANPSNSAQLGGSLYHSPSYIRVRAVVWAYGRGQTDRHTDVRDHNTFCVVYDSRKM